MSPAATRVVVSPGHSPVDYIMALVSPRSHFSLLFPTPLFLPFLPPPDCFWLKLQSQRENCFTPTQLNLSCQTPQHHQGGRENVHTHTLDNENTALCGTLHPPICDFLQPDQRGGWLPAPQKGNGKCCHTMLLENMSSCTAPTQRTWLHLVGSLHAHFSADGEKGQRSKCTLLTPRWTQDGTERINPI